MSEFNARCAVTKLPVVPNEEIVLFLTLKSRMSHDILPVVGPFYGTYDGYGSIELNSKFSYEHDLLFEMTKIAASRSSVTLRKPDSTQDQRGEQFSKDEKLEELLAVVSNDESSFGSIIIKRVAWEAIAQAVDAQEYEGWNVLNDKPRYQFAGPGRIQCGEYRKQVFAKQQKEIADLLSAVDVDDLRSRTNFIFEADTLLDDQFMVPGFFKQFYKHSLTSPLSVMLAPLVLAVMTAQEGAQRGVIVCSQQEMPHQNPDNEYALHEIASRVTLRLIQEVTSSETLNSKTH